MKKETKLSIVLHIVAMIILAAFMWALADALDQDWQSTPVDGIHRFSEKEEYFDNYVNWTQNR